MNKKPILIIGAGMAGCFLAISLAQKGHRVKIIEKRGGIEGLMKESGRSFNLTLYYRGILALKKIGIWKDISPLAELAEGNVAHFMGGTMQFDRFDNNQEVLYTIHRSSLNRELIRIARKNPLISITFDNSVESVDLRSKIVILKNSITGMRSSIKYSVLVGADGAYSAVRTAIQASQSINHTLTYSDWGYKEVWISPVKVKQMNLRKKSTHTWPRDNSLLLAFPNPDFSVTLMFNLPLTGIYSFATLTTKEKIKTFITKFFPELLFALPEITDSLMHRPLGNFVTIKTSPWYYKDSVVLVGDAAHAVLPFYGQGMCAAFEDSLALTKLLTRFPKDFEKAFSSYQTERKINTDILAELSVANFIELRDRSRSEKFVLKDRAYTLLSRIFPKFFVPPLYVLIAHTTLPYDEAISKFKKQERRMTLLGLSTFILLLLPILSSKRFFAKRLNNLKNELPIPQFTSK